MAERQPIPAYEQQLQEFLQRRGCDPDAQAVTFNLFRAFTDVISAMEARALRPLGLTHAGFVILMMLWITGPRETRELARAQRVSKPAIVSAVDTLARGGYVRRIPSETDRRLVSVGLTAAGRRLIERAQHGWHSEEQATASGLSTVEQRTLVRLLRKLRHTTATRKEPVNA